MYGFMPMAATEKVLRPPPLKRLRSPSSELFAKSCWSAWGLAPGTEMLARTLKMRSSISVKSSLRRSSGMRIA